MHEPRQEQLELVDSSLVVLVRCGIRRLSLRQGSFGGVFTTRVPVPACQLFFSRSQDPERSWRSLYHHRVKYLSFALLTTTLHLSSSP